MSQPPYQPVTQLLVRWKAGDQGALEELVPLVHNALRDIARHRLQHERPGHTLQSAAVVHEALRLVDQRPFDTENPPHFFSGSLALMRQILVDYARSHGAAKRSAYHTVELDDSIVLAQVRCADLCALDDAPNGLLNWTNSRDASSSCAFSEDWRLKRLPKYPVFPHPPSSGTGMYPRAV